mmetsp:Transcript_19189/g.24899  ORF Transcript_19189/g.24899 Transcript_19189/m.24899 type:complete len:127 (+) Transcript_19189:162-542(+)
MLRILLICNLIVLATSFSAQTKVPKAEYSREKLTKVMRGLNKENFDTIYEWEPWLSENAGATLYAKTMRRLEHKAKSYGIELKPNFLAEAKATAKRREKKAEYEKAKAEAAATSEDGEGDEAAPQE